MPLTPEQQAQLPHCPFCGRAPRYLEKKEGFYVESAICDTCHVSLPPAVWSRRAQPEAQEAPSVPAQTGIKKTALQATLADQAQELGMGDEGMVMPSPPSSAVSIDQTAINAEVARLRESNRALHRRAQQIEAPAQSYQQRLAHIGEVSGQAWVREFDRLIRSHTEVKRIFQELARAYEYPMNAQCFHSVMDSNVESGGKMDDGVYANCFLSKSGGMKSYRVLDEVRRAVDELLAGRAALSQPVQAVPDGFTLMSNEDLQSLYIRLSGKRNHASTCATSNAPAETPGECDCEFVREELDALCPPSAAAPASQQGVWISIDEALRYVPHLAMRDSD